MPLLKRGQKGCVVNQRPAAGVNDYGAARHLCEGLRVDHMFGFRGVGQKQNQNFCALQCGLKPAWAVVAGQTAYFLRSAGPAAHGKLKRRQGRRTGLAQGP